MNAVSQPQEISFLRDYRKTQATLVWIVGVALLAALAVGLWASSLWVPAVTSFAEVSEITKFSVMTGLLGLWIVAVVQSGVAARQHHEVADRLRRCEAALAEFLAANRELEQRLKGQEEEVLRVSEIDGGLWGQPCADPVRFVARSERRARLLSVFNLKGGVGKTTITANLGAALCELEPSRRVLIVDLDFQGTLSSVTTADGERAQRDRDHTTCTLLQEEPPADASLERILAPSLQSDQLTVITANDLLEQADFREQAQFLLDRTRDPRHRFRSLFHHHPLLQDFDVVLFDCPPRLTTSSVNALCASDHVLIPVQLTDNSWEAVPRTVKWLRLLKGVSKATPLGVVANQVRLHGDRLISHHHQVLGMLTSMMHAEGYEFGVLEHMIKDDRSLASRMLGADAGGPASALFQPLAKEVLRQMAK